MKRLFALSILALLIASSLPLSASATFITVPITVDSGGNPLPNALVSVKFDGSSTGSPYVTGSNGVASFPFLGNGTYMIGAAKFGYVNQTITRWLTNHNASSFPVFNLAANTVPIAIGFTGPSSAYAFLDGVQVALPVTENWVLGSTHNITAPASLPNGPGNSSRWGFASLTSSAGRTVILKVSNTATFTEAYTMQYALHVSTNRTRGVVTPATEYVDAGASVSLLAQPAAKYRFANWTIDSVFTSSLNPLTLAMNSPNTVVANFVLNSTTVAFQVSGLTSLPAIVDGKATSLPATFSWVPGSTHTVSFQGNISRGPGSRLSLTSLSLNGQATALGNLTITVPQSPSTYVMTYTPEFLLSVNSTDQRAVAESSRWYKTGTPLVLSAPGTVLLADGSELVLSSYSLDGVAGSGTSVSVTMNAPHTLFWTYSHDFKLSVSGIGNDGSDLGNLAAFTVQPSVGASIPLANHNSTFLPMGVYSVQMTYGGEVANTTRIDLTQNFALVVTVNTYGVAGQFNFKVVGGFLNSFSLDNDTLTISVSAQSGVLRVFIPPGVYTDDFFTVSGVSNSTFDQAQRLLVVPFTGAATVVIGTPSGQVFSLSTTSNAGSGEVVQGTLAGQVVSEFSAFCGSTPYEIGVNFLTPTTQLGLESAVPFRPIFDPEHQYSLTFGYCENGVVLVAVQPLSQMTFAKVFQSPQFGELVEVSPVNAPTGNPIVYTIPRSTGAGDNVYELKMLGTPVGAFYWTLGTCGTTSCPNIYVDNLNNGVAASATVTAFNKTVLAVQGSIGTVAFSFASWGYESAQVVVYGTAPVEAVLLPGGTFGPQTVNFDGNPENADGSMTCVKGLCSEVGGVFGGFETIKMQWKALPTGGSFNVTVNGDQVMTDGTPTCRQFANLSSALQPGIDLNQCVNGAPAQGASGDGYFSFTPSRAGQFVVCVSSKTFAGYYSGCETVYAQGNTLLETAGGIAASIGVVGVAVYLQRKKAPPPSIHSMGPGGNR